METHTHDTIIRLLIASLGGSPQPVILTASTYRPERIVFFTSHDTVKLSAEVLASLDYNPKVEYEITDDPNLLSECYKKCRLCIERAEKARFRPDQILVDYTGGTKVMTAALLLSGIGKKFRFNYVGGNQRDKAGVGIVLDGHEKLFSEMSPWVIFAEEERRQVVTLFNNRRFSAVIEVVQSLLQRGLPIEIERYFKLVRQVAMGLLKWDQFDIKKAYDLLSEGIKLLEEHLQLYPTSGLDEFFRQLKALQARLQTILSETKGLTRPHGVLIDDLLNNARRRMVDRRNDDAAARIYRALELYGQICFHQTTGCNNDSVEPNLVPEEIRDDFIRRYGDRSNNRLKLPLQATFTFLEFKNHAAGHRFKKNMKEIKNIQSNRNDSILAHGLKPIGDDAVQSIFKTIAEFVQFNNMYDFPTLP